MSDWDESDTVQMDTTSSGPGDSFNKRDDNRDLVDSAQNTNEGGRRRNYNQDNSSGFSKRDQGQTFDNQQDNNQNGGGERRRRNRDDNMDVEQQDRVRFAQTPDDNQDGGGERRRRNRDDDNQDSNNLQNGGGERRRNRDGPTSSNATGETSEAPKEKYIPRAYNKNDEDLFDAVGEGINFASFDKIPVQVSGENIPEPIQRFSDIAKDPSVIEAIKKSGYKTLTPIQKYGIAIAMNGRDLMASAQTGSGKTIAFLLPIVENLLQDPSCKDLPEKCSPQALIITPTRELAIQIFEQALKLTFSNHLKPCVVYGGTDFRDQTNRVTNGANIVVATPGRLIHLLEKNFMSLNQLKYFVLDEADRMVDKGFSPSVERVVNEFDISTNRQTMMFSATFPEEVQRLAQTFLNKNYIFLSVGILGAANADVKQEIREVQFRNKRDELEKILKEIYKPDERILVFCERKKMADFLAANLCDSDFKTTSIHGDRVQSQREIALNSFKKGETPILVATSVAARGLDIKNVGYVINFDLPKEIEEYVHRIGRTGRVGNSGNAISFYCPNDDSHLAPTLAKLLREAGQPVPKFLSAFDDGCSFANKTAEKDTRHDDVDTSQNMSKKTENYSAPVADESEDW